MGGGSDVRGLYKPEDYGISRRRTNGTRQRSKTSFSGFQLFAGWTAQLCLDMKTVNALNLQPATIKSRQLKRHYLARVDELKAEFSGLWGKDSKPDALMCPYCKLALHAGC